MMWLKFRYINNCKKKNYVDFFIKKMFEMVNLQLVIYFYPKIWHHIHIEYGNSYWKRNRTGHS
jgi:hypothetical protein